MQALAPRALQAHVRSPGVAQRSQGSMVVSFVNGASHKATVPVKFVLPRKIAFGQSISLVGSKADLGAWDPTRSIELAWHEGDQWTGEAQLPAGEEVEYKYLIKTREGVLAWQPGQNMCLTVPDSAAQLLVVDDWSGAHADIKVTSAGPDAVAGPPDEALVRTLEEEEAVQPFAAVELPVAPAEEAAADPPAASAAVSSSNGTPHAETEMQHEERQLVSAMGAVAVGAALVSQPLEEMTVKALKQLAKEYGLSQSGRKMDLVDRIRDALGEEIE